MGGPWFTAWCSYRGQRPSCMKDERAVLPPPDTNRWPKPWQAVPTHLSGAVRRQFSQAKHAAVYVTRREGIAPEGQLRHPLSWLHTWKRQGLTPQACNKPNWTMIPVTTRVEG